MTPQERDLITSLINRLHQVGNQPKDRDAEELIRQGVAALPDTPYLLVQTVLIQDMALSEAHNRITDLEKQVADAKAAPPAQPTSFLGARGSVPATGPWAQPAPARPAPPSGSVWTQSGMGQASAVAAPPPPPPMAPLAAPGASSGFLQQAATTAAGIAGGALLFQGISSLFGPHMGGGFMGGMPSQPGIGETVVNNYYGDAAPQEHDHEHETTQADWGGDPGGVVQADDTTTDDDSNQDFSTDSGNDSTDV